MENTDKPKNTKPQIFRDTANDENGKSWLSLRSPPIRSAPRFRTNTDSPGVLFVPDAVERGYYEPKRRLAPISNSMLTFLTA